MSLTTWLWGTSQLDDAVDKATSELLPSGAEDIALNLEICDQIRSKSISAKEAMRALKRRLNHKNPNVQLLALGLTDICIKNGGDHFLTEVASREFMDNLVSILKMPTLNIDVKNKILRLIQNWGIAFEGKASLSYVGQVYKNLKTEGFTFPPQDMSVANSAMVDTQTAPEWIDSDVCLRCRTAFSFTNRKHHCRNCGQVFDHQCSSKTMALPHYGITQEVRVCDGCHTKLFKKGESRRSHRHSASMHGGRHRSARELADAELQRAIQLSLEEVGSADIHRRPGYVPSQPSPSAWQRSEPPIIDRSMHPDSKYAEEDDDPDLRAAIEASLREAQAPRPSAPVAVETPRTENLPFSYEQQPQYQHSQSYPPTSIPAPAIPSVPKLPNYDLEPLESDAILTFSQTVEQVEAQGGRDLSRYPAVNELLDRANGLRPKLAMSLDDTGRKEKMLSEMHDKLSQAVKLYDNLLTQQVSHPIWSRSPPPQAVQYQSVNPGYNPAYHAPNGSYAQWAPQQPPQMQIQAPPMSPGYQQHPGLATPRQTQVSNFQPTQSASQYALQAPAELTYSPRVSSPPSVDQWQRQSMYAEPSQQAQYAPPPSQPSYVPQSPQHYSETSVSAPPPPASIPHYNPPQPSMAPPSSSVRPSSPPAPLSQPASIPQYNPPQPSMVPPSSSVPQSSPPAPVSQPPFVTPAPPNPTTFPPPSANPSSSGLARHNTMSAPRPLQQAQNNYLSRHNTITVGPHAQQHQQAPLPQFPVVPTSAPQSFPLYGPSIPDNLPQPDRKEALLIDL